MFLLPFPFLELTIPEKYAIRKKKKNLNGMRTKTLWKSSKYERAKGILLTKDEQKQ
jgi:hypothetical protein